MRFKHISLKLIFLLTLVLLAGCADLGGDKGPGVFDLDRISADIERPESSLVALDVGAEDEAALAEENIKIVPVRDINTGMV